MLLFLIKLTRYLVFIILIWWNLIGWLYVLWKRIEENEDNFFFNLNANKRLFILSIVTSILSLLFFFLFLSFSKYYYYVSTSELFDNKEYKLELTNYNFNHSLPTFNYSLKYNRRYDKLIDLSVTMNTKYSEEERKDYLYKMTDHSLIALDYLLGEWYGDVNRIYVSHIWCIYIYYQWHNNNIDLCNIEKENIINELENQVYLFD